jgi:hypothetical protein
MRASWCGLWALVSKLSREKEQQVVLRYLLKQYVIGIMPPFFLHEHNYVEVLNITVVDSAMVLVADLTASWQQ